MTEPEDKIFPLFNWMVPGLVSLICTSSESGNVVEYILEYFNAAHASFVCSGICSHITVMAEHQITHLFLEY